MLPSGFAEFDAGRRRVIESQRIMQRSYRNLVVTALVLLSILVACTASATSPASNDTSHAHAGSCARRVRRAAWVAGPAAPYHWTTMRRATTAGRITICTSSRLKFAEGDYCADSSAACFGSFSQAQLDLIALGILSSSCLPARLGRYRLYLTFNPIDYVRSVNGDPKVFGLGPQLRTNRPWNLGTRTDMPQPWDISGALQTANNAQPPSTWWLARPGRQPPATVGPAGRRAGRPNWQSANWQSWIGPTFSVMTCGTDCCATWAKAPFVVGMAYRSRRSCRGHARTRRYHAGRRPQRADRLEQRASKGRSWINSGFVTGMTTVIDNIQSDATFTSDGGTVMVDGGWQYGTSGYNSVSNYAGYANIVQDYDFPTLPAYSVTCSSFWSSSPTRWRGTDGPAMGLPT